MAPSLNNLNRQPDLVLFRSSKNRTWATKGIIKFPIISSINWYFCDLNKRAINHPFTVNY